MHRRLEEQLNTELRNYDWLEGEQRACKLEFRQGEGAARSRARETKLQQEAERKAQEAKLQEEEEQRRAQKEKM